MKLIIVLVTAVLLSLAGFPGLNAQETSKEKKKEAVKAGAEGKTGIQNWMASFWARISKVGKKGPSNIPTSVAGLRGAEQEKGKDLTPYWKGKEKSKDSAAMAKVEALINKKDFNGAIDMLRSFGQQYPDSPLKPIAVLSLAYAYTEAGKAGEAKITFENFLNEYPEHELASDARAGLELLAGKNK
ncbi:MAG: outer membrane protein assembly factor BamD [Deltaproteobacteria bacterium]|nr:outer membrane protein assembly factor BamD [Deltaproteobacteria bacterium]